jgi:hypothetical protein
MGKRAHQVGEALATFLQCGDDGTPMERGERRADLCEGVSWLLMELMDGQPDWDARYVWLDGVTPSSIRRTSAAGLELIGGVYVVNGQVWRLRPVHADLALPPRRSTLCFAAPKDEVPLLRGSEDRLAIPPDPLSWPYVFEVVLG